jgi:hypothetical protein
VIQLLPDHCLIKRTSSEKMRNTRRRASYQHGHVSRQSHYWQCPQLTGLDIHSDKLGRINTLGPEIGSQFERSMSRGFGGCKDSTSERSLSRIPSPHLCPFFVPWLAEANAAQCGSPTRRYRISMRSHIHHDARRKVRWPGGHWR